MNYKITRASPATLTVKFHIPWYKKIWYFISRKKKPQFVAGSGDYLFVIPKHDPENDKHRRF